MIKEVVVNDSKRVVMLEVFAQFVNTEVKDECKMLNEFWDGIKSGDIKIKVGENQGVFDDSGNSIKIFEDLIKTLENTYSIRKIA